MKEAIAKRLVKALRSGKYKQGQTYLNIENREYCCLGVLCEILKIPKVIARSDVSIYSYGITDDLMSSSLPEVAMEKSGMKNAYGDLVYNREKTSLSTLNDHGTSFPMIADIIEANWEAL